MSFILLCSVERRARGWSYRFHVQNVAAGVQLTSVYLWLHKTRDISTRSGSNLTLTVHSVYDDVDDVDGSSRSRTGRYQLSWTSGWVQLDITELVRRPGTKLTVRCVGSSASRGCRPLMTARSARRRPFVVVTTTSSSSLQSERRSRRNLRPCVDGDCCTLYPYYVNFADLNWTFIQRPTGFSVNFCYGSCTS